MIKKKVLLLCLMIVLVGICGCGQQSEENESSIAPTGYPDGEIQRKYVYYDDTLYVYSDRAVKSLPENCELVGKVLSVDNINLPQEDFGAARLVVGDEVYAVTDEELLYVKVGEEWFGRFVPEKVDEEESSVVPTGPSVGEIQRKYVYYDGILYVYSDSSRKILPENCEFVGLVSTVDNINLPQEDFAAARLMVGDRVYAATDEELLYVKTGEERFERFVPEKENVKDYRQNIQN